MFNPIRGSAARVLIATGVLLLVPMAGARAQTPGRLPRLAALQQQNAALQQRNAVQTAALQTSMVLQGANQQYSVANSINLQLAQNALGGALQQNAATGPNAAVRLNTLQNAAQQLGTLQAALPSQSGVLTTTQLQLLSQVQADFQRLLIAPPPRPVPTTPGG
jgi:hypothetical protein